MKSKLLVSFLSLLLSCSQYEIQPELNLLEKVAIELEKQGLSVTRINESDQTMYVISGSSSLNELAEQANLILLSLGHQKYQFKPNQDITANSRIKDVECQFFDFYDSGGVTCVNYLCVADLSFEDVADICDANKCFIMGTRCLN